MLQGVSVSYALSDEERGSTPTAGCGTRKWNASIKYLHKNRENRISLIVTVHGRFFNSYRNFESSVKRIDSVKMRVIVQIEQIKRARNCSPGKSGKGLTGGA